MRINETEKMARELMDLNGLQEWRFRWDSSTRRAGVCRYGVKEIGLSRKLIVVADWSEHATRMTILHEIAHALAGPFAGHGYEWRRICLQIGGDGQRCYQTDDEHRPELVMDWMGTCPNGHVTYKARRPTQRQMDATCGRCSRRYNPEFKITWTRTVENRPTVVVKKVTQDSGVTVTFESETKVCMKCGETKPLDRFGKSMGKFRPDCKDCVNAAHKAWREGRK